MSARNSSLFFLLFLTACSSQKSPDPTEEQPPAIQAPSSVHGHRVTNRSKKKPDRLLGVICVRMDQLHLYRYMNKRMGGRAVSSVLVDATPKQAEVYARTGKWIKDAEGQREQQEKDQFNGLMDVGALSNAVECFDESMEKCLQSGSYGIHCHNQAVKECQQHQALFPRMVSRCKDLQ